MGAHPGIIFLRSTLPTGVLETRKQIPTRRVLEAVLWILNTGAQWHMLPQSYPNYKTVHQHPVITFCGFTARPAAPARY